MGPVIAMVLILAIFITPVYLFAKAADRRHKRKLGQ